MDGVILQHERTKTIRILRNYCERCSEVSVELMKAWQFWTNSTRNLRYES